MTHTSNCKPGCRYVGLSTHPVECEPRGTVGAEAIIYERGGYIALDSRGHYADRPGPSGKPHTLRRCAHIPEGFVGLCMQCRPPAPSSAAAMLNAALDMLWRIADGHFFGTSDEIRAFVARTKRDAEAREGKMPASCWQCDAPLGTTEACLTCAAKRREGASK